MTIGFVRDQHDEDEFYLEIQAKSKGSNGERDCVRIPVDDIDEIEHIQGSLQFFVHYQTTVTAEDQGNSGFKGLFKKKEIVNPGEKVERSE